ncbi:PD-(D/E)XK nuclease family protein [Anabaena subtropica]|uniref:PD-(D/E)XK nuclease family protein n=1 Tax=Anabaena subtropica FACHB-260 TaxID=2692884 RepID=A0ABR8CT08_9NOST|nr:PD-(D/E)XK nuclease family protein [Anabaena subtropica]MBD2346345.1 PD-(D/E)XK nuclease family protein [Anabaena subtropica FACHB-260]
MSLFKNLLNLHSSSKPLEDFFTEIIAYFLSINTDILIDWLKYHSIISEENYININILTQKYYEPLDNHDYGSQPDIVIELTSETNTDVILIESKIAATEGDRQLQRYAEILSNLSYPKRRSLIYITRDYDPKESKKILPDSLCTKISFHQLRWYQFHSYLTKKDSDIFAK